MEQLHFITKLLDIKDPNIQILDIINKDTHKEIIAKLDYDAPSCPECGNQLKKYDFQKPSKIPYLETTGMPTRILLRKRRFKCYHCSKMMVAETSIVKKNHQIPRIINQKIAQKLIEKISMTDIAHQLSISTSTVIRKLNDFHFKHDFSCLPEIMSWDEYAFTKGKMSFIAQDFDNLNIITVLEGRTQAVIRQLHFITKLLDIKDPNIQILDIINKDTHKEIIAKLDYDAPSCPECGNQLKKYDFQKPSKIPYLETTGMPTRILLRKCRFKCYHCSKMMVAETSIVKKNHQIPRIINQKIAQKLIEKISMTDIAHQLFISTSTVIRKLNDFHFKHDFSCLPEIMSWDVETVRVVTVSIGRWR
ncbi:IS1167, transposase [Streptococcus pneumoniae]|nr:IS1167, transposase [Streptococcus pneumoniae]